MKKAKSIYKLRLSKGHDANWHSSQRCELWLGPDHLLHARKGVLTEQYRRLFFKDIQGVTLAHTDRGRNFNIVLGLLTAIIVAISYLVSDDWFGFVFFSPFFCAVPLLVLVVNVAKGPTCACWFHTAVQREPVGALSRLRKARRVLAALAPMLEQAQGPLEPAQVEEARGSRGDFVLAGKEARKPQTFHSSQARMHRAFFLLCFVVGISHFIDLIVHSEIKNLADTLMIVVAMLLGVLAIKDQFRSLIQLSLQRITTLTLVVTLLFFGVSQVIAGIALAASFENPDASFEFQEWEYFPHYVLIIGVIYVVLSTLGLLRWRRYRASLRPPRFTAPTSEGRVA